MIQEDYGYEIDKLRGDVEAAFQALRREIRDLRARVDSLESYTNIKSDTYGDF